MPVTGTYGLLAEFETADELIVACRQTREAGYTVAEAYSPYPLPEAAEALGRRKTGVAFTTFLGGLVGGAAAFFMQYWAAAIDYPINVGGRPLNSWPSWIPITFELTVLTASFSAFWTLSTTKCGICPLIWPASSMNRASMPACLVFHDR